MYLQKYFWKEDERPEEFPKAASLDHLFFSRCRELQIDKRFGVSVMASRATMYIFTGVFLFVCIMRQKNIYVSHPPTPVTACRQVSLLKKKKEEEEEKEKINQRAAVDTQSCTTTKKVDHIAPALTSHTDCLPCWLKKH